MDPLTGTKLQFVGSGTFSNGKMNGAAIQAEKPSNGTLAPPNNDGIPIETVHKTIKKRLRRKRNKWTLIITFTSLVLIIIFITIAYLVARQTAADEGKHLKTTCTDGMSCSMNLIETIPTVLKYKQGTVKHESISRHWGKLINGSKSNIDILSYYWTLNGSDVNGGPYKQAAIGEQILTDLRNAANRGVQIRIVQNKVNKDTAELSKHSHIQVRTLDMKRLMKAGIIHTKFFAVDGKDAYVGSANFDWRALTEVKELGIAMYGCSCTVADVSKIFETNWMLAEDKSKIPFRWPKKYQTQFNKGKPIVVHRKDSPVMKLYWSTSPPRFCPPKRTSDIDAILDMIKKAKQYIYIGVMDYVAAIMYTTPEKYWDVIDRALRAAVFNRGVVVHLMTSKWANTRNQEIAFLKSLHEFGKMPYIHGGSLKVKMFQMPNSTIPFSRVSHSKFMVTDNAVFVSTSNWSGDYFENTGGISLVINETTSTSNTTNINLSMHEQLRLVFLRDWGSNYTKEMDEIKLELNSHPPKSFG